MELGEEAAELVSKEFPKPVKLEFEKVYCPYLLMSKKRYAGLLWTQPGHWDKMDTKVRVPDATCLLLFVGPTAVIRERNSKQARGGVQVAAPRRPCEGRASVQGIETVRRDNCLMVRKMVTVVLDMLLKHRDPDGAVAFVKNLISDLLLNKVDMADLVVSKSLSQVRHHCTFRVSPQQSTACQSCSVGMRANKWQAGTPECVGLRCAATSTLLPAQRCDVCGSEQERRGQGGCRRQRHTRQQRLTSSLRRK
jgi:DNA polymerase elongation subunit (family B)